jgi:hypothetical protein
VEAVHDYIAKLRHPRLIDAVVNSTRDSPPPVRGSLASVLSSRHAGVGGPISINLDLTVACNYRCTHCIDLPILNTGERHDLDELLRSLVVLRLAGLRSVILIGGGEPTLHPRFGEVVIAIKALGLQCAIVSNGSENKRIVEVAAHLRRPDWVRLSLDAGTDASFQDMHQPRKRITLEQICAGAAGIKQANSEISLGYSYIVSWPGAHVDGRAIIDNIDEIPAATILARDAGFDYIAFKPLLDRDELGGETIDLSPDERERSRSEIVARITAQLARARELAGDRLRVLASLNLTALATGPDFARMRIQPPACRMRQLRQVLTPTGVYGCPVYRGKAKDRLGPSAGYASVDAFLVTRRQGLELTRRFDASIECRNVTCLYNSTNWWLDTIQRGEVPTPSDAGDEFFL